MMKLKSIVFASLLAAIFLVGCSKSKEEAKKETNRIVTINNNQEPEYLDPSFISDSASLRIAMNLYEGLVKYNHKDASPVAAGATHWDVSKNQKVYTFYLRKESKWSDGKPVTAHDYAYAWERVLNPKTGSRYAFALYHIKNGKKYNTGEIKNPKELGIRVIDDHTLEMTLEAPAPFILSQMCFSIYYPIPKWAIEKHGPRWVRPGNIVSNGAFKLQSWAPYKEIVLLKSETYWDKEQVRLAGARFLPIEDMETGLRMYENGQIDINYNLPPKKIPTLLKHPDLISSPWFTSYWYQLNTKVKPLDDVRVRRALAMAIDRDTLVNKYLQKVKTVSSSLIPPGVPGYTSAPGIEYDPIAARKLLSEAGYADPSTFPKLSYKYNTDEHHKLVAQVIQQMWKKNLGIEVSLINEEWKTFTKSRDLADYQMCRYSWIGDYLDPNTFLELYLSYSSHNSTSWGSKAYDSALEQATTEKDSTERLKLLNKAEAIILSEATIIPLYAETKFILVKPYVKGVFGNLTDLHPLKEIFWAEVE